MQEYLQRLNNEQRDAVLDTEGYVLVFAGAGSGKTRVLTTRIAHILIENKAMPDEILAITFTNKAAEEMRERLCSMGIDTDRMWVSTIHSMCVRILRNNIGRLSGYNKNFSIYSEVDRNNVLKRVIKELGIKDDKEKYLKKSRYYISGSKNNDIGPGAFRMRTDVSELDTYAKIYEMYEDELHKSNALDFDDILLKAFHLLDEDEEVLNYYSTKFKYIHIDEFQDTNMIQMEIAKLLCSYHKNLFVVGDDDQSIYGWRGAEIRNILEFEKTFKGTKVHKLEQNYRSTKRILQLANKIIKNNSERKPKSLWTENGDGAKVEVKVADNENYEAEYTAFNIKRMLANGSKPGDFAVLMRINALSRAYEQEFAKYNIPFKVFGGFKFFERKEIKDLIAYLRIIENPLDNESILRIINVPKRGIGEKTLFALIDNAKKYDLSVFDGVMDCEKIGLGQSAKNKLSVFKELITSLVVECSQKPLTEILSVVLSKTDFLSQFEVDNEENYSKKMNIDEFQNAIEEFAKANEGATLSDFLNSVTLSSDTDELEEGNYVTVATIHSVKGLEFKNVFICGLDETFFPISRKFDSDTDMEEERRLMYVAITRARERLFLTRAACRFFHGERQYTMQSQFLDELSDELGIRHTLPRRNEYSYNYSLNDDSPFPSNSYGYSSSAVKSTFNTQPKIQNTSVNGYKSGVRVKHAKFGVGTVIAIKGEGKNLIADVAFPGVGIKSMAVAYAPMEIIK